MRIRSCLAAVAAMLLWSSVPAAAQTRPPIQAFASLPDAGNPSLSPDGKLLALIQVQKGRPVATVWSLEPKIAMIAAFPIDVGLITDVNWANNSRLLITVNSSARYRGDKVQPVYRMLAIDADGKNPVVLFSNKKDFRDYNASASRITDLAPNDPDHIYMPLYVPPGRLVLHRVNVNDGTAESVQRGGDDTFEWIMDGNGNVLARLDQTNHPLTDHLLAYGAGQSWKEIASADASNARGLAVYGSTMDGKALVVETAPGATNTSGLAVMSLADGSRTGLFIDPMYDVSSVLYDPWSGRVIGASVTRHLATDLYFDPNLQAMQRLIESYFPGLSAHAINWDAARQKIIVRTEGPNTPQYYALLDLQKQSVKRLAEAYPGLQPSDLGLMRVYDYKARDGVEVPAYLTVPPGKTSQNLPVVILPHGGPMARDDMRFDWESQFLANRGYAVLRPNFRGSYGYGRKFMESGYGQWGLKMQDDVTDGVRKLIADGIADPKRICIVGSSYGGYAALAGAALTPDLYACAAAWAPVTDLRKLLYTRAKEYGYDSAMISSWQHFVGDRWDDSEKLDAASPSENADKIKAPVLLMHGVDDATVRIDQSEVMDRALRRAGKKVTFVRIEKETHYMQTSDTRIRWLTELEKFLKENIGN